MTPLIHRVWRGTTAFLHHSRRLGWVDLLVLAGVAGAVVGLVSLVGEWTGPQRATVEIDLSPWSLPRYTFFSLSRGLAAYVLSLAFTLAYGYWAAKDRVAERVLVPLLDILQSIPVLGFMPGLVLMLVSLFPRSNIGLELAAVVMIFTAQAWNMTFSFYNSVRSMPAAQLEPAAIYRFTGWQRFKWVELPFSTIGLVWNSMMSMAGGWFFLMINEAFRLGDRDYRLPGIGSYMSVAVDHGNVPAMLWAIVAMVLMIVAVDQMLWRPVVVWALKFRLEEGGGQESMSSWFVSWLGHSRIFAWVRLLRRRHESGRNAKAAQHGSVTPVNQSDVAEVARLQARSLATSATGNFPVATRRRASLVRWVSLAVFALLIIGLASGAAKLVHLLHDVRLADWAAIGSAALLTLGRVLLATALGTVWALPAGIAIGLSPRLSRILQPVVQIVASFPAPMLFPLVIVTLKLAGVSLAWGSVLLMLLGTQWYILFNVIAGAMAVPADLREAARSFRFGLRQRFWWVYAPAVFPYLVTGWVTAAGGAWNASIVSEYVASKGELVTTHGLGATISQAAEQADFPMLAAGIVVMSAVVVLFNRTVWRRCYRLAEERFSVSK